MSERFAWIFDKQKQKKIWCADMWARKAVLAVQTAITGIVSRLTTVENAGYQTASDVSAAIATAIGGITELEYLVVSTLPASGTKGVIYLVPHQHGTRDIYDEYIWVNNAFEKIGNTDVDLSQYLLKTDISAWAKASTKPTYTASEVGALPSTTAIPSKVSELVNDSGFITGYTETDPTVPAWAKTPSKPTYTASEVGALSDSTVIPGASSAIPSMDGTGAAGSSADYARADHVHPSDTSKQNALSAAQLAAVNSGITADDIAVNNASVLCTVTPIEPTLTTGTHNDTLGRCYYYKVGYRVHIHIGILGLTSGTTADLWYMPAGYRPRTNIGNTGTGSSMTTVSRLRVDTDGRVYINANAAGADVDIEYDAFQ